MRQWFAIHKLLVSEKTKLIYFKLSGSIVEDFDIFFHSADCVKHTLSTEYCDKCAITNRVDYPCSKNCFKVESVKSIKYLGLVIDMNLNWKDQVSNVNDYLKSAVRKMYQLRYFCSAKVLIRVYYGIVHSKLQYGIVCWGGSYFNTIEPILLAQKHIIRIICHKTKRASSWVLFCNLRVLPLRHLYIYKVLKMFFVRSGNLSFRYSYSYNLRTNIKSLVTVPSHNKKHFFNFYTILAPVLFNSLPQPIRNINMLYSFMKSVVVWLYDLDIAQIESLFKLII